MDDDFEIAYACVFCAQPIAEDQVNGSLQLNLSNGGVGWYQCHAKCFEDAAHDPIDITTPAERPSHIPPPDPQQVAAVDRLHAFWDRIWQRVDERLPMRPDRPPKEPMSPGQLDALAEALENEARGHDALAD